MNFLSQCLYIIPNLFALRSAADYLNWSVFVINEIDVLDGRVRMLIISQYLITSMRGVHASLVLTLCRIHRSYEVEAPSVLILLRRHKPL